MHVTRARSTILGLTERRDSRYTTQKERMSCEPRLHSTPHVDSAVAAERTLVLEHGRRSKLDLQVVLPLLQGLGQGALRNHRHRLVALRLGRGNRHLRGGSRSGGRWRERGRASKGKSVQMPPRKSYQYVTRQAAIPLWYTSCSRENTHAMKRALHLISTQKGKSLN